MFDPADLTPAQVVRLYEDLDAEVSRMEATIDRTDDWSDGYEAATHAHSKRLRGILDAAKDSAPYGRASDGSPLGAGSVLAEKAP